MSGNSFYQYFRQAHAWCHICGKRWSAKNCQGVAARHALSTGHKTGVEIALSLTYYQTRDDMMADIEEKNE